ncbi:NusG domain II-containing protein [Arhodomonas sp. AD133]|uniref:NusG domain II-containing protein n=1 Tax=Arhodomonas sp. AD133 TaxID=3415009 RepID=UPI003EBE8440
MVSTTDVIIVAAAVALVVTLHATLAPRAGTGERAEVWVTGELARRVELAAPQRFQVTGPLGVTAIAVSEGRIRVTDSPGRRKLCVRAGWLTRPGETAVCLPNRVVVQVTGGQPHFDAINQ